EQDGVAFLGEPDRFEVDLGDQRAGSVDGAQAAAGRGGADGGGHAVGAVEDRAALGDLVDAIHEDDTALAETLDDGTVVDDLVIYVQRRAEQFEGALQALDGHVNAGAEAAGISQNNLHGHLLGWTWLSYRRRWNVPSADGRPPLAVDDSTTGETIQA